MKTCHLISYIYTYHTYVYIELSGDVRLHLNGHGHCGGAQLGLDITTVTKLRIFLLASLVRPPSAEGFSDSRAELRNERRSTYCQLEICGIAIEILTVQYVEHHGALASSLSIGSS